MTAVVRGCVFSWALAAIVTAALGGCEALAGSGYRLTIPLDPPTAGPPRPEIYGPAGRPLVVIDAGHGGHDPGAVSRATGRREKDLTLAIARQIKDQLLRSGRVRVALTRENDHFLILRERSGIARVLGAMLFISIHADAADTEADGATVYTVSETASDREAELLAQRENQADVVSGVDLGQQDRAVASILLDLAQRESMEASARFARLLKREATGLIPFRPDYHRMADFAVLKSPDMASVLLEVGYLSSQNDSERLASTEGQQNIAAGVGKAIDIYAARWLAAR